ncbi:restriction endonuclease, partial [Dictyobacter formicarum]|uniref:restriction endonuclease n=1 Tax=Dictyobacter formicarum TaxID=2778368 RepID=UPI0019161BB8
MSSHSAPPLYPDIKRELKSQLLAMSARSFEFFAGDFLTYAGLEDISVTRYVGDGGIDAHGTLVAGQFQLPLGIQVKRYRNNVQRPDIDRFVGALSGHFSNGLFVTTADYAPQALKKATASVPRVLTLNGEQIVSLMIEHRLGVVASPHNVEKLDIDSDYFASFEAMKSLWSAHINETPAPYRA